MKLLDYFSSFLRDTVNLNQSRLDDLDSRVGSITTALTSAGALDGIVLDTVPQGSWAHETIIKPFDGLEFDADFLVQLAENAAWAPKDYFTAVSKALGGHPTYATMTSSKARCLRITYANDCHIDVVPYVVTSTGREVIVNRNTNEFEDTNPIGFTAWLQEKDAIANRNLRRVLRLLKYLRDHRGAFAIKSVLLTTLVGNLVLETRPMFDPDCYKDTPTTLLTIVEDLDAWLQARPIKPVLVDPSCPTTSFSHRWTDAQYATFRDKIHALAPKIAAAYNDPGVATSLAAWQGVFGDPFKAPVAVTASAGAPVTKSLELDKEHRAPRERFIDEMMHVNLTHTVGIVCEVSEPNYPNRELRRRALRSRGGRVPKRRSLLFKIDGTNVPEPFDVFWKVRNYGREAAARDQLRGEIHADEGRRERSETTSYTGHHYVECYVVKNGVCVAIAHERVVID